MTAIDWTNIFQKYKGQWIALKDDEKTVISSGKTLRETEKKAKEKGMLSMIEDGFSKAILGITSIEEILRVTKE